MSYTETLTVKRTDLRVCKQKELLRGSCVSFYTGNLLVITEGS